MIESWGFRVMQASEIRWWHWNGLRRTVCTLAAIQIISVSDILFGLLRPNDHNVCFWFTALFGGSAGAVSISMHMVSDFSRGLFHKAIMMSGNFYMPWAISPITNWTQRVANKLGWDGEGGDKSCLSVLQRASHHAIIKAQDSILTWDERNHYTYFPFSPVIEPYESAQCFLSQHPRELISSAWSKDMPTIIGFCSEEGLLPYKSNQSNQSNNSLETIKLFDYWILDLLESPYKVSDIKLETTIPHQEFNIDIDSEQCRAMAKQLKKFYFGYSSLTLETILVYCKVIEVQLFISFSRHVTIDSNRMTIFFIACSPYSFNKKF